MQGLSTLLYYSHLAPAAIALIVAFFVYFKKSDTLSSWFLTAIATCFFVWSVLDLSIWLNYWRGSWLMFAWSSLELFSVLLFVLGFYFVYVFLEKRDLSLRQQVLLFAPILPLIIFAATRFNLLSYDLQECVAVENLPYLNYIRGVKIFFAALTLVYLGYKYFLTKVWGTRKQILILGIGIISFLYAFFVSGFISERTGNFIFEIWGLFAMVIFIAALGYLIVRFAVFNIRLIAAQALVFALVMLIGAQFFFIRNRTNVFLNAATFVFSLGFGYLLVRNVKKELKQREKIEHLAGELSTSNDKLWVANEKLKELDRQKTEFVSIASHQLRSPLTSVKGYASMLLEGSFGPISDKAVEAVSRIFQSSQKLVLVIEDFLNISRIELGTMKYEIAEIDLKALAENLVKEIAPTVERNKLKITFESDPSASGEEFKAQVDSGKISQVISNLIDNGMKYTHAGSIAVKLAKVAGKIRFSVTDTGIGIAPETMPKLFEKFSRADDAGKVNIKGTGLGLYVAKQIVEAHKGKIWAESEGVGKGSTFIVEFA